MPTQITIKRNSLGVEFEQVSIPTTDTVFWQNLDTKEPHWPTLNGTPMTRTQVGKAPSQNSDTWPPTGAGTVNYQCSLHPGESGVIVVYAPLASVKLPLPAGVNGTAYRSPLISGGVGPFTFSVAPPFTPGDGSTYGVPPGLSITATTGPQATVQLSGTPSAAGKYTFALSVTDSVGNNFQQKNYTITIS
jgi:hypothetical protein